MRLIASQGRRLDMPPTDLDNLITLARTKPYQELSVAYRERLRLLLILQHTKRERIRFAPINYGDDDDEIQRKSSRRQTPRTAHIWNHE